MIYPNKTREEVEKIIDNIEVIIFDMLEKMLLNIVFDIIIDTH